MIIFDQLRLSDDAAKLYINARVNKASNFVNVYIDTITIIEASKVSETDPGSPTENYLYAKKINGNTKELNLVLTANDFMRTYEDDPSKIAFKQSEMSKTLFFVYITWKGTVTDLNIPCSYETPTLGVVFDENILYQRVMGYTKDLLKDCTLPTAFMDFILLWNAFKAAIETEHYIAAIKFYNMLFGDVGATKYETIKACGCNG